MERRRAAPEKGSGSFLCRLFCFVDCSCVFQFHQLLRTELEGGGGDVFFEVRNFGSSGNWKQNGGALQEPSEGELGGSGIAAGGDVGEGLGQMLSCGLAGLEHLAGGQWIPGHECDAALLAPIEGFFVAAVSERIAILHGDDGKDLQCFFNLRWRDFAEADVTNFALLLHLLQGAKAFFERGTGVDAVKLVEIDALEFESSQAHLDALNEVSGAANVFSFGGALACDSTLGGDDEAGGIRMQGFSDEALGNFRAVGISGVDEGDAQIDCAPQDAAGFCRVGGFAPSAFAHEAHGSEAEPVDRQVCSEEKCAAGSGGGWEAHGSFDATAWTGPHWQNDADESISAVWRTHPLPPILDANSPF